jgi:hypothetical protein
MVKGWRIKIYGRRGLKETQAPLVYYYMVKIAFISEY